MRPSTCVPVASCALLAASVAAVAALAVVESACGLDEAGVGSGEPAEASAGSPDAARALDGGAGGELDAAATGGDAPAVVTCDDGATACSGVCVATSQDLGNCGGCGLACVGADAACASGTCTATLRVRGYVDDVARFVVVYDQAHWLNVKGAAPGLWRDAGQPTVVDGVAWQPMWPTTGENRDCNCTSSTLTVTPLAARAQTVTLTVVEKPSNGVVTLAQPVAANAYSASVEIDDPGSGPAFYEFVLGYATR